MKILDSKIVHTFVLNSYISVLHYNALCPPFDLKQHLEVMAAARSAFVLSKVGGWRSIPYKRTSLYN